MKIVSKLLLIRMAVLFAISYFADRLVPYLGFFPQGEIARDFGLPKFIYSFANFDGVHYIQIASSGYQNNLHAFFPLYPLFMKLLAPFFAGNFVLVGLFIANVSLFIGVIFLHELAKKIGNFSFNWVLIFTLAFPTAFFYSTLYTEGLFFMFFLGTLNFLYYKKNIPAFIFGLLASLTRLIGVFLVIPIFFYVYKQEKLAKKTKLLLILSPLLGLLVYCFFLLVNTGDPFYFLHAQPSFGANRSTNLILLPQVYYRYLKIFLTATRNHIYYIALVEFVTFTLTFVISLFMMLTGYKKRDTFVLSLSFFSLGAIILPTLTGTFSSIPRYALFAPSVVFFLAGLKNKRIKIVIAFFLTIIQIILFSLFIQGYFVS